MHSSSIVQANNSNQLLIETCQLGKFCGKTVDYSKKWESFFIALAIIGLCSLATGAGLAISGMTPICSWSFISLVGTGALSLTIGISGKLVSCIKKRTLSIYDNSSETNEIPQIPNIEETKEEEVSNQNTELEDGWISEANQILLRSMRHLVNVSDTHSIEVKIEKDSFLFYSKNNEDLGNKIYFIRKTDQDLKEELVQILFINNEVKEILYKKNRIEKFSELPSEYIKALEIPYINFLKQNAKYYFDKYALKIEVFRPGIQLIPAYHLERFTKLLSLDCNCILNVTFIFDEKLITKNGEGVDCGGPTRDFLNELVKSLYTKEAFVFRKLKDYYLYIPTIQREDLSKANTIKDIPSLTEDEEKIFQQVGKVFMFAFKFDRFTTGYYLDPATFYAIHILTSSEINQPFAQLSNKTKLKMCKAIAQVHKHNAFELICDLLLTQEANEKPNLEDLRIGAQILLDMEEINEIELEELMKKENHSNLLNKLLALLLTENTSMGVLNARLAPIHAIARGMKSLDKKWKKTISQVSPYELNLKIQGNINRQVIIDSIQLSSLKDLSKDQDEEIRKKTGWLKNWILNCATDQETKALLKFLTGSPSLASGIEIKVYAQDKDYLPVMKANSCFYKFYLSPVPASYGKYNDSTEEEFIRALKDLVLKNPGDYSEK